MPVAQAVAAQATTDNLVVDPKFKLSPQSIAEELHIANSPALKSYRDKVEKTFNEIFLTAAVMSSGEFVTKSATVVERINTLSALSSGLPFAPMILSSVAIVADSALRARRQGQLANVAELNPSSNPIDAAMFSGVLARRLTITHEAKINSLAQSSPGKNTPGGSVQELSGISSFLESIKKLAQDQMTNLDPAMARGLFGEVYSQEQLLAYKDSKAAVEYVLEGKLKNKSNTEAMVAEIVEAVTNQQGITVSTIAAKSATSSPGLSTSGSSSSGSSSSSSSSSSVNSAVAALRPDLLSELKNAVARKKEQEKAETPTSASPQSNKIEGLTKEDVEEIVKQATGGLSIEAVRFIKQKFEEDRIRVEEDRIRGKKTESNARAAGAGLMAELCNVLQNKSSDSNVKPSEVLPKTDDPSLAQKSGDNTPKGEVSVASSENLQRMSELERRNEEQAKQLEDQAKEMKRMSGHLEQLMRERSEAENKAKKSKDGCCVVS